MSILMSTLKSINSEYSFYDMSIQFWMSILMGIKREYTVLDEYYYEYTNEYSILPTWKPYEYTFLDEYTNE